LTEMFSRNAAYWSSGSGGSMRTGSYLTFGVVLTGVGVDRGLAGL
jgi:hypothetical protein